MKKSSLVALVLGSLSGLLFALGMCMALIPQWGTFTQGIVVGAVGIILALATLAIWRKMTGRGPVHVSGRTAGLAMLVVAGALLLGVGICLTMVWNMMVQGIVVGLVGIVLLIILIPLAKGVEEG